MVEVVSGFFRRIMRIVTIAICIMYLAVCLVPFIDTGAFWYISILGLGFVLILAALIVLMIYWIIVRSKMWIACLVVLLLGTQQILVSFAFHLPGEFQMKKENVDLRVMQWNVHSWNQMWSENDLRFPENSQPDMMALIKKYNPDVLCVEEFFESIDSTRFLSNVGIIKKMGYPYHIFSHGDLTEKYYYTGIAIFSKYPIIDTGTVLFNFRRENQPVTYADVNSNGKIIRVIALHLQSVNFREREYINLSKFKRGEDPSLSGGKTILSKLRYGFKKRQRQSWEVVRELSKSPYPIILCGDFNDVPNSGVYFNISENLQDAFLKKGSFIGRTFRFISPTLRIDYIMASRDFKVKQFKRIRAAYSDHYPLVADVSLK